jgi:sugar/nucleoside kinase (ribokinase family)
MKDSYDISNALNETSEYAIVSANHVNIMKNHLFLFKEKGIKTFFDPGQQITQMTKKDLEFCFNLSDYIILNEYEYEVIKKISEKTD